MAADSDIIEAQWKPADARVWEGTNSVPAARPRRAEPTQPAERSRGSAGGSADILSERWPMLAAAMKRYRQNVAEQFTAEAYQCVKSGIIRLSDRKRLAGRAADLNIRPFDAQLLIACAIRQASLDQAEAGADAGISETGPIWRRTYWRLALLLAAAALMDAVLVWSLHV